MKHLFSLKKSLKFLVVILFLTTGSANLIFAQTVQNGVNQSAVENNAVFVKINGLDPYSYNDIVLAVKENPNFKIKTACVPADLIMFEIVNGDEHAVSENFDAVKEMIIDVTSLTDITLLVDYSEEVFLEKCRALRTQRH